VLDAAIVNVALPTIQRSLGFSAASLQWVVNAYTLVFGGFLMLGGRVADKLGRRRVFTVGMALFTLASFLGGLSQNEQWLIFARGLQGLGGAILAPATLAIITTTFEEGRERNRAMGVFGAVAGSGGAVGVLLGGILTQYAGWRWVLFVNVPIGILVVTLSPRLLGESRSDEAPGFDIAGAATITGGLISLVYGFVSAAQRGWGDAITVTSFVLAAALLALNLFIESRSSAPLVPLGVFRRRNLTGANVVGLLVGAALFAMFFFISLYLQRVLGYSAIKAGVSYLPLSLGIIVSAGLASQLVTRLGAKKVIITGLLLTTVGLLLFTRIHADGTFLGDVLLPSVVVAFGLGFSFVPLIIAATAGVTGRDAGLASGLINTSQQIGGALGLAVLSTIATSRLTSHLSGLHHAPTPADVAQASVNGYTAAFAVGAAFAFVGAIVAMFVLRISVTETRAAAEHGGMPV
jgi:EmrB/QacA subfamily drug resistance transporter